MKVTRSFRNFTSVINFSIIALQAGLISTAHAGGTLTWTPVTHVYSPKGFDSNDDTQIVVEGYLPNPCYQARPTEVSVQGKTISVSMKAYKSDSRRYCPEIIVPFLEPVSLGVLKKGTYQIFVNRDEVSSNTDGSGVRYSEINIIESEASSIDDYIYANVKSVEKTGNKQFILKGENPGDCFELDRVEFISNDKDTYSILPILKQTNSECTPKSVPFSYKVQIPDSMSLPYVKPLLHVRIMNGRSVNMTLDGATN